MSTKTDDMYQTFNILVRARYPLIYILSWEEDRVALLLNNIASDLEKRLVIWTVTEGFFDINGKIIDGEAVDPFRALNSMIDYPRPALFLFKDYHPFINDPIITRRLRDLRKQLNEMRKTCFIVSPVLKIPVELEKLITVIDFSLPNMHQLESILQSIIEPLKDNPKVNCKLTSEEKEHVLKSALGLTMDEAENVYAKSLVQTRTFDPKIIIQEKEQIIRKSGILEYYHSLEGLDSIGGMDLLKEWLATRQKGFTVKARDYGLPFPKGLLLIGVQGCGKSLTAKAIASLWKLPLLRLDVGRVFGGIVGESEQNIRKAIKLAESISPSILWIDEIEKGFAGVKSSGSLDAGTTSRVFGAFITWLQEKEKPVFVVATANSINQLPPELLRKGRFDEIFFVDLPSSEDRKEIFKIHLKKRQRKIKNYDLKKMVSTSKGFSGAEIEQAIISAMFSAFEFDREVETQDIIKEIERTVPISRLMKDQIAGLRTWAHSRARSASLIEDEKSSRFSRDFDVI